MKSNKEILVEYLDYSIRVEKLLEVIQDRSMDTLRNLRIMSPVTPGLPKSLK
jgi:hypothetical protein